VAVLEKKLGLPLYNQDIFVNIAGGIRLNEPGVDLGIVIAIASSKLDQPVPPHTAVCGEVGLTGEVRAVSQIAVRLKEASRLGFSQCLVPKNSLKNIPAQGTIEFIGVETIQEAIEAVFNRKISKNKSKHS
jgi:DNA repair protein RadA/Sms